MRFLPLHAPEYWEFRDPDTGLLYKATTKKDLISYITSYRTQNELENIHFIDTIIDNYMCSQKKYRGMCQRVKLRRGILGYIKGGLALLQEVFTGEPVKAKEANRRSAICAKCPFNIFPDTSGFHEWSDNVAIEAVGSRKAFNHNELGSCKVCTCTLKAKVWLAPPFRTPKSQQEVVRPVTPNCWMLPENEYKDKSDID